MALLLLRTELGIFFHLSALVLVLVLIARVNEVPLLILLPQVVVALLGLLILEQVPYQGLGRDPLLRR